MKPVLSPRDLGRAIGISESSVKRWIDDGVIEASRTAGGHRRIAATEAIRFVRSSRSPLVHPDVLGLDEVAAVGRRRLVAGKEAEELFDFLKEGSSQRATGLLMSLYLDGRSMAQIIDGPLKSAMERVGELWTAEPSGIFWEHRATQIAIQAVSRLRWVVSPDRGGAVAVGGAPSGDPYQLPSLCVAAVVEAQGLEAVNLGPETPLESLAVAADSLDASLVWLSVTGNGKALAALAEDLDDFAAGLAARGCPLILGGANVENLELSVSDWVFRGSSMVELEALIKGMRISSRSGVDAAG
jgi:methanogenic corrinoid protein MtbC1